MLAGTSWGKLSKLNLEGFELDPIFELGKSSRGYAYLNVLCLSTQARVEIVVGQARPLNQRAGISNLQQTPSGAKS